ncbi:hypothetical protein [Shouchella lonarensis]|uniref:Uncharacterized protein n=1 Tax=Shouchella lonarensis TaxID=1464122 RepID=A0A1G6H2Q2_9BACI|nr:hypothetical protein [Shouchella lonarensis]SDB88577.1 hypothetical protein SAMN05421737_102286 [Shouchella lonarensis]
MLASLMVACAVFFGWILLDFTKTKQFTREIVLHAFIIAVISGIVWYVLDIVLSFFK